MVHDMEPQEDTIGNDDEAQVCADCGIDLLDGEIELCESCELDADDGDGSDDDVA